MRDRVAMALGKSGRAWDALLQGVWRGGVGGYS